MACTKYFVCSCFYTRNYFIPQYGMHVVYKGRDDFVKKYKTDLMEKGCISQEALEEIVLQLDSEYQRRRQLGPSSLQRTDIIQASYKRLHPHVYTLQDSFLAPEFLDLVAYCTRVDATAEGVTSLIREHRASRVYSFPVFTAEFCKDFLEEILNFEATDLPKGRPNTMNNYGVLLDELGLDDDFLTPLRERFLNPICRLLYPDWGGGTLDSHKAFIVSYSMDHDRDLDYHYDNAEVTLNVALSGDFEEGSLYFTAMRTMPVGEYECTEYKHKTTTGVLHRGQHRHGAMPISEGQRHNFIVWMRSSRVRNNRCPMCDQKPELVETVGYGDGFKEPSSVDVCSVA